LEIADREEREPEIIWNEWEFGRGRERIVFREWNMVQFCS